MYYNFFYVPIITNEKDGKRAFRVDIFETTQPETKKKIGFFKWFFLKFDIFKNYEYKGNVWIGFTSVILGANNEVLYYTVGCKYEKTDPLGYSIYDTSQFREPAEDIYSAGPSEEKEKVIKACTEYSKIWG